MVAWVSVTGATATASQAASTAAAAAAAASATATATAPATATAYCHCLLLLVLLLLLLLLLLLPLLLAKGLPTLAPLHWSHAQVRDKWRLDVTICCVNEWPIIMTVRTRGVVVLLDLVE